MVLYPAESTQAGKFSESQKRTQYRRQERVVAWLAVLNWSLASAAASTSLAGCNLLAGDTRKLILLHWCFLCYHLTPRPQCTARCGQGRGVSFPSSEHWKIVDCHACSEALSRLQRFQSLVRGRHLDQNCGITCLFWGFATIATFPNSGEGSSSEPESSFFSGPVKENVERSCQSCFS